MAYSYAHLLIQSKKKGAVGLVGLQRDHRSGLPTIMFALTTSGVPVDYVNTYIYIYIHILLLFDL